MNYTHYEVVTVATKDVWNVFIWSPQLIHPPFLNIGGQGEERGFSQYSIPIGEQNAKIETQTQLDFVEGHTFVKFMWFDTFG